MTEKPDGLDFEFAYRSDLYEAATIEAFAARLIRFLDHVTADPGLPIGDVGLRPRRSAAVWVPRPAPTIRRRAVAGPGGRCRRTPRPRGGGCSDRTVTYRQLVVRAESLAVSWSPEARDPASGWPVRCRARSTR
ncbi:hypothetical protein GS415_04205 [Rhodococcus hoagii]|nr:hypothetical protein [Prescottella equi]